MSIASRYVSLPHAFKSWNPLLPSGNEPLTLSLPLHEVVVFDKVPEDLSEDKYYIPLSANFAAIDALVKDAALQHSVATDHPIKGVQTVREVASLFPSKTLNLVFIVPESIASGFREQPILTTKGTPPAQKPSIRQFVVGLPLGIDTSSHRKRKLSLAMSA